MSAATVLQVAEQGLLLDQLCMRHYGHTTAVVEAVLEANPHLSRGPVELVPGTLVSMPAPAADRPAELIRVWD
jgi:phage tail protein X